jgi:hypothetical protein
VVGPPSWRAGNSWGNGFRPCSGELCLWLLPVASRYPVVPFQDDFGGLIWVTFPFDFLVV